MSSRSALAFAAGPVVTATLSVVAVPLMAHLVQPADIGRYYLLQTTVALASMTFALGLDQAYVRDYHSARNRAELLRSSLAPGLLLGFVVGSAVALVAPLASWIFDGQRASWAVVLGMCLVLATVNRVLTLMMRLQERAIVFSITLTLPKVTLLLALVFIVLGASSDFTILAASYAVALLSTAILATIVTRCDLMDAAKASSPLFDTRLLRYGVPLAGAAVLQWFLYSSAAWFIRGLADLIELGIYSVTVSIAGVAVLFQAVFATIWAPTAYRWVAHCNDAPQRVERVARAVLLAATLLCCVVGVLSPLVMYVLPAAYTTVPYLLPAAVLPPLLVTAAEVTGLGITVARRPGAAVMASLAAVAVAVVLLLLLVPDFGATGAVLATGTAFAVMLATRTRLSVVLWTALSIRGPCVGMGAVALVAGAQSLLTEVGLVVWAGIWGAVTLILAVVGRRELRNLLTTVPLLVGDSKIGG